MTAAATHRDLYPEQYNHPLIGRAMRTRDCKAAGIVSRVMPSRFGALAVLGSDHRTAFQAADLQPMPEQPIGDNVAICGFNGRMKNQAGETLSVWTCLNWSLYVEADDCDEEEGGRYMSVAQFTAWQKS